MPDSISTRRGAVTSKEALKSSQEFLDGRFILMPPSLAGSARRFISISLGAGRAVRFGTSCCLTITSSYSSCCPISGTVRVRLDHLLYIPCV